MATLDFAPLFRSSIGFDQLPGLLSHALARPDAGYPPTTSRRSARRYRIVMGRWRGSATTTSRLPSRQLDGEVDMHHHGLAMVGPFDQVASMSASLSPSRRPRTARGLSGRATCRIYARGEVWILELDAAIGWLNDRGNPSRRRIFPTLAAAIGFAERHGLDYRIEPPRHHPSTRRTKPASGQVPRSWLARLARNGRNGDIYHV